MKLHYFDQQEPDVDSQLMAAKHQGYVPSTCLLGGAMVWHEVNKGRDPCSDCNGPREKCKGRSKS